MKLLEFTIQRGNNIQKKQKFFFFRPTVLHDHAASRLVKKPLKDFLKKLKELPICFQTSHVAPPQAHRQSISELTSIEETPATSVSGGLNENSTSSYHLPPPSQLSLSPRSSLSSVSPPVSPSVEYYPR